MHYLFQTIDADLEIVPYSRSFVVAVFVVAGTTVLYILKRALLILWQHYLYHGGNGHIGALVVCFCPHIAAVPGTQIKKRIWWQESARDTFVYFCSSFFL